MEAAEQMSQQYNPVFALADQLVALRDRKKELEEQTKETNAEIERVERELVDLMRIHELQNFKRSGKMFIPTTKTFASPKAESKERVYAWLKENGYADLVKETVHAQSFSSLVNEWIEQDGEIPEPVADMINLTEKVGITIRKG
mgnify:CR=1 FL=1|jgi:predicted aldo/keto reductase-like oxidoreductase